MCEEDIQNFITLYNKGMSPAQISKSYGGEVSTTTVRNKLLAAGIRMRDQSTSKINPKVPDIEVLKEEYAKGDSTYTIGKRYDVAPAVIWHRLHNAGVEMRDLSRAKELQKERRAK